MSDTFYLVDYENVHNNGIGNIDSLTADSCVHIFYTNSGKNIDIDFASSKTTKEYHKVPDGAQSLDMHLISYMGYLMGTHGTLCTYIIISKDKDYDKIIKFWKEKGYTKIYRKAEIPKQSGTQSSSEKQTVSQTINHRINTCFSYYFEGEDRSELNKFMQQELAKKKYKKNVINRVSSCVVSHCNDVSMLSGIHNDLKNKCDSVDIEKVYRDVKEILDNYAAIQSKIIKKEAQLRSFFGQHFKKKIYVEKKEDIIELILYAKTRQQINNELMKIYKDGEVVSHICQMMQPFMKDLPGK